MNQPYQIVVPTLVTTLTLVARFDIAVAGTLNAVRLKSDYANPNGVTEFDVKKNGTSIYGTKPQIATSGTRVDQTGLSVAVVLGDEIEVWTTIIQTGGIGNYLIVQIDVTQSDVAVATLDDITDVVLTSVANTDFLQRQSSTWVNRTVAQVMTSLGLTGTNSGNETTTTSGALINGATAKTTPVDADFVGLMDSAASNILKKLSWANIKATMKAYLDGFYQVLDSDLTTIAGLTATTDSFLQSKSSAWAARTIAQVLTDLQGTGSVATDAGFRGSPQNSQSAAYGLVLSDAGKTIFHPSADTTARIWTIPANASVAYGIGTLIGFTNQNGAGVITIAITTDTMRLAGAGTTGSRTLAANGKAVAEKVTSTEWIISGTGLT